MTNLNDYVLAHSRRGACQCGRCADAVANPSKCQPGGHTADMMFFKVANEGADAATLRQLVQEEKEAFSPVNMFDGKEHNYLEVGGFVGDHGIALQLMGLGHLLGLWKLLTPTTILGIPSSSPLAMQMAVGGMVAVQTLCEVSRAHV